MATHNDPECAENVMILVTLQYDLKARENSRTRFVQWHCCTVGDEIKLLLAMKCA